MAYDPNQMMVNKNQVPYVPTGYESLGAAIQQKQAIAKALLEQGLSQDRQMRSPFELLGHLAQTWAGKSMQKEATKEQTELDAKRAADYQTIAASVQEALARGATPEQIATQYGSDPRTANMPIVKAMLDAYGQSMKNRTEVGAPMEMTGPDGKPITGAFDKAGGWHPTTGLSLPGKVENVNGVAVDLQHTAPGTVLPQNLNDIVYRDPKTGQPVVNQPLVGAKESIAKAGKTQVTNSTYVNAMDKSFGKVIPEAVVADLTKSRDAALAYTQTKPELDRAAEALRKGIIGGFAAGTRMDVARAADFFGITGKSNAERIANTQTYIQNMGRQTLPILQALRPASDTDVKTAQMMAGGDVTLSPRAMMNAINAAREAGANSVRSHKARVKTLQGSFGSDPQIAAGLGAFDVPDIEPKGPPSGVTIKRIK